MTGGSGRNHTIGSPNNHPLPVVPLPSHMQRTEQWRNDQREAAPKRTKYEITRSVKGLNPIKLSRITLSSSLPIRRELRHMKLTL
ncbi:hypothetical protein D9623_21715 [Azospirillum brasilense]|uniref:Uncharacterized protein n=1 Tax=Azospirillum brasilense TaxID=192 RepID=A0A4D8QJR7_AZOBR|nr:hypothetical protein [Azospirillum brasilense]NUB23446.1 hypothetical protein [Azospirillum brasilense]NUB30016.1 hypothetical protein [Azospirillum brasilense]QCO11138.1 hypothetical protein D3868_19155 [Azospirillum brasilense]QEL92637.1 hypothetical protein D9621_21410 [Azospirillum brasilense]